MTMINARYLEEALAVLADQPGTLVLQGGTDAMVSINFGRLRPSHVISLRGVDELRQWHHRDDGSIFIGAGVTYAELENGPLATIFPALAEAARTVGSPQIRASGTIGGNLGTCSPAGDALPVLSALDAVVDLRSLEESRSVPFTDFMTGPKRSVMKSDELIVGVRVRPSVGYQGYAKVGVRNAMVISVASTCLVTDTLTRTVRIAIGSVGPTIIRCTKAEALIADNLSTHSGWHISLAVSKQIAESAADDSRPIDDHRSTAAYRRHAIAVLTQRLLERANQENSLHV